MHVKGGKICKWLRKQQNFHTKTQKLSRDGAPVSIYHQSWKFSFCYSTSGWSRAGAFRRAAETPIPDFSRGVQRTRNKFQVYLFCLRQELFGEPVGVRSIKPGEMKYGGRTNSLRRFSSSTVIYDYLSILSWLFQRTFSVLALRFVPCDHTINSVFSYIT